MPEPLGAYAEDLYGVCCVWTSSPGSVGSQQLSTGTWQAEIPKMMLHQYLHLWDLFVKDSAMQPCNISSFTQWSSLPCQQQLRTFTSSLLVVPWSQGCNI